MLYDYQIEANKKIKELFKTANKICFAASCGAGKNYMAIGYIDDYLQENPEAKVLVLTHGQRILKNQFSEACSDFEMDCHKLSSNFKKFTIKKYGELNSAYNNHNVFIALPQIFNNKRSVPHFDFIIVDEGHQFYFAEMVQRIIKNSGASKNLSLTGTPSPFIKKNWPIIPIPMDTLFPEFIQDFIVELCSSSYKIEKGQFNYETNEINENYAKNVLNKKDTESTLEDLLNFIVVRCKSVFKKNPKVVSALRIAPSWVTAFNVLQKTMIACHDQEQAKKVKTYFENRGIKALLSISKETNSVESDRIFEEFKKIKEYKVLIVVGRGVLGFSYSELANVIDMTCSANPDRVFQLMSRLVRKSKNINNKLFIKLAPIIEGKRTNDYFCYFMTAVMCLTNEYWFTRYNGDNFLNLRIPILKKNKLLKSRYLEEKDVGYHKKKDKKELPMWLGVPAIKIFKDIFHKDDKGNYSYKFTTLAQVRKEIFGFRNAEIMEKDSNNFTRKVCAFKNAHNRKDPSQASNNKEELKMADWLGSRRAAYTGRAGIFYDSDQKIAEELGYPDMFKIEDLEDESNKKCAETCKFKIKYGRYPSTMSKSKEEKVLGRWLSNRKKALRLNKNFYSSDHKIADSYGLKDMFKTHDPERESNKKCVETCKFIDEMGRNPGSKSKNKKEKSLGVWLLVCKRAKKGVGKRPFYVSDQKIADSMSHEGLFEELNTEKISNDNCKRIIGNFKKTGILPKRGTYDYKWISHRKGAFRKGNHYTSDQKIAEELMCPDFFKIDCDRNEKKALATFKNVFEFIKKHGKEPSQKSKNGEEKSLGVAVCKERMVYKGNLPRIKRKVYDSLIKMAESYGHQNFFSKKREY